jgi:hypothetical protein
MIDQLVRQKKALITYLLSKVETEDWHGVADAAMDLREVEAKLEVLAIQERLSHEETKKI